MLEQLRYIDGSSSISFSPSEVLHLCCEIWIIDIRDVAAHHQMMGLILRSLILSSI